MRKNIIFAYTFNKRGFTLIEVLVAFSIFSVVVVGSVGAVTSVIDANRKSHAVQLVTNNLSSALENMTRSIRVGRDYHCRDFSIDGMPGNIEEFAVPRECESGGDYLAFESSSGSRIDPLDQVVFRHIESRIERSKDSGATWFPITDPNVTIESLKFIVVGTDIGDIEQPLVTIFLNGTAGTGEKVLTKFRVQTSVSQRLLDY